MSLLFNMLSRLVITFLPRSKRLLLSWLQSPSAVILEPRKIKSDTVSTVSPSICHEVMGPRALKMSLQHLRKWGSGTQWFIFLISTPGNWCMWSRDHTWGNAYLMHRTKRAHFWNSKALVFLLLWKVNPLVSTTDLSVQGTEALTHLSPSTLAVTTLLTKQLPPCSLAPHQVSLNSSKWHLILWLASRKRRLPFLKLHTLWSHPLDPLLHQLIQAISGSLIWHLLLTLPQMWEVFVAPPGQTLREFNVQLYIYFTGYKETSTRLLGAALWDKALHRAPPIQFQDIFLFPFRVRESSPHLFILQTNCLNSYLSLCDCMW